VTINRSEKLSSEDLLAAARDRAKRLADDLSADAADVNSASSRILSDDDRREGQSLVADAVRAARRLHDALNQTK
jgi:hypothetical protein